MDNGSSLSNIASIISGELKRFDIASGEDYLATVAGKVATVQERLGSARDELWELVSGAAAAQNTAELRHINEQAVTSAISIFSSINSAPMLQEFCTTVRDAIAERALELSRTKLFFSGNYSELPLALLSVGSDGRSEQTLFTDQDYLFLHGSGEAGASQCPESVSDYFGMLGSVFVTKMEEAGISRCNGGIMPINHDWRGTLQQWQDRLTLMFRFERNDFEKNILNIIALADTRFVCGDRNLGLDFGQTVRSRIRENNQAIRQIARVVSSMKLSRGFLRRFIVEAEGPHKGEFNLKIMAWMPLVMCIRLLAVDTGIEETHTLRRIELLRSGGHISEKVAAELSDSYLTITSHRINQQIKKIKRINDNDCYINPYQLPGDEREELKNCISRIDELQHFVRSRFSMATAADHILSSSH